MDELIITGLKEKSKHIREKFGDDPEWWKVAEFSGMYRRDMRCYFTVGEIVLINWYGRKWFMELSK